MVSIAGKKAKELAPTTSKTAKRSAGKQKGSAGNAVMRIGEIRSDGTWSGRRRIVRNVIRPVE